MVPTIDLAGLSSRQVSQAFGAALEHVGFAIITRHGIQRELLDAVYAATARVFAYSDTELSRYTYSGGGGLHGFTRFGVEHAKGHPVADLKRFWHVHRPPDAPNIWPSEVPEFRQLTTELFERLDDLSFWLLDSLNEYLGYPAGMLRGMVRGGDSLLRLLHYPALTSSPASAIRSAPHEDINFITLLVAGTASGLQIQERGVGGGWHAVNEEAGSIVVNAADMLQLLTKGRLKSATHRVVNPPSSSNTDRYSAPFFVHPRPEVVLDETGFTAGQYLKQRLQEIGLGSSNANEE